MRKIKTVMPVEQNSRFLPNGTVFSPFFNRATAVVRNFILFPCKCEVQKPFIYTYWS